MESHRRVVVPAVFAMAVVSLLDAARLLVSSPVTFDQLQTQVLASIASFEAGWALSLAFLGIHLVTLAVLLRRTAHFPTLLGLLLIVTGFAHLADAFAAILIPDFDFTPSALTFFGQTWFIFWLLWRAFKGFPAERRPTSGQAD